MTAPSYAKINLFLHITGRRPDGYHDIHTLFCAINLYDTVTITPSHRLLLENTGINMPVDSSNIICRIDDILRSDYGLVDFYKIVVHKRIPVGAGLGGGSSNACTYLRLVNNASELGLSFEEMHKILSSVGSDAPFFLYTQEGRTMALGQGRGELLTPLKNNLKIHFILINPGIFVSTPSVYNDKNLQLTNADNLPRILTFMEIDQVVALMANDMQYVVFERHPLLQGICSDLDDNGAVKSMMSGSGSTVFGIFRNEEARDTAYNVLKCKYANYMVAKADSL